VRVIEVVSYLRNSAGQFSQLDVATGRPGDPRHIEGAIELTINGVQILDTFVWDYVDQLWAYISDMIVALGERGEASTYFPDQPIRLSFRKQGLSRVLVTLELDASTRRVASINESELVNALRVGGLAFFRKMSELVPENRAGYEPSVARLNRG
jgi:hypothetical protein